MTIHDTIAKRLPELRRSRGLTAKQLAEAMTAVGIPWDRNIVANFENRRREGLSVEELLALAYVLNVAPVHLLVPLTETDLNVTPTVVFETAKARAWIRGKWAPDGTDERSYFSQVPESEFAGAVPPSGLRFLADVVYANTPRGEMYAQLEDARVQRALG